MKIYDSLCILYTSIDMIVMKRKFRRSRQKITLENVSRKSFLDAS